MSEDRVVLGTGYYCIPKMVCNILRLFKRYLMCDVNIYDRIFFAYCIC